MRKIENITQLRQEYARLSALKCEQEELLSRDMKEVANSLKPVNLLIGFASDFYAKRKDKSLLTTGLNIGLQVLTSKILSHGSGGIMKAILAFVGQNVASNLINSKSKSFFDRVKGLFNFNKDKNEEEDDLPESDPSFHKYN